MENRFTLLAVLFLLGFLVINNLNTITSYVSFYTADDFGAGEEEKNTAKDQYKGLGFGWLWLFLILAGFILYLEKGYFEDSFITLDLYRRLYEVYKLIKRKKFVDAIKRYYLIQTEFDKLHAKRSRLKKRVMRLRDEVELYLKANHAYELAKNNKIGLVKAMNEVLALANKVAKEAPEDEELYKYAKKQYDYCNRKFRK